MPFQLTTERTEISRYHPVTARVAALFVSAGGCYAGLPGVDPWDEARDARQYAGPYPVVAHPPCQRWGKMWFGSPLWVKRTGERKLKGDDNGCFEAALAAVRRWGGVLEHPWGSHAWPHFGLNTPPRKGGWVAADFDGGWTCCVEQGRYGHYARKPTLLLAYNVVLPALEWGESPARFDPAVVERMGLKRAKRLGEVGARGGGTDSAPRIGTPVPFRDLLLSIARSATTQLNTLEPYRDHTVRPDAAALGDRPSIHGRLLGKALALMADLGRRDAPFPIPDTCLTCAFRDGSMPNQTAGTGVMALNCVLRIDPDRFACHHGMKEGEPQKLCSGYIAAMLAPFSQVKEILTAFHDALAEIEDRPDDIREAFDTWLNRADPERRLDVYQAAREYAKEMLTDR